MEIEVSDSVLAPYREMYYPHIQQEFVNLIVEFFIVFSRFEYTLKQTGYHNRSEERVEPNWDSFCNDYKENFQPNKSRVLSSAVKYYRTKPTMIQIFMNNQLDWRKSKRGDGEHNFAWLMRIVRYTRNNLFHGGKFPYDPKRDTKLLTYGLVILYECLELDDKLFEAFHFVE